MLLNEPIGSSEAAAPVISSPVFLFRHQYESEREQAVKNERDQNSENPLLTKLRKGQISRRQFMQMSLAAGLGAAGISTLSAIPAWRRMPLRPLKHRPAR